MTPADQKERDKRHVRSLQNPRLIQEFRLCNVSIAEADRPELLGIISWLIQQQEAFRQSNRRQTDDRTGASQHSASA